MADDVEFAVEKGTALGGMAAAVITAGAATGPVGLSVGLVMGLLGVGAKLLSLFGPGDPPPDETLRARMDAVEEALTALTRQVLAVKVRQAVDANRAKLRDHRRLTAEVQVIAEEVKRAAPGTDWVTLTNRAGVLADLWLSDGLDMWRWHELRTPGGRSVTEGEVEVEYDQFCTLPALPSYLLATATWVLAREQALLNHPESALMDDRGRRERHHAALSTGPSFRAGDPRTPAVSIPENLADRVRQTVDPRTTSEVDGTCTYDIHAVDYMTGVRTGPDQPRTREGLPRGEWCFIDPYLPSGDVHHKALQDAGLGLLQALEVLLGRLLREGTLRDRGPFRTGPHPVTLFRLALSGELTRLTHPGGLAETGLPSVQAPEQWAKDWDDAYILIASGGGRHVYALRQDRRLVLHTRGGAGEWLDPVVVAGGWDDVIDLCGSGHGVLYTRHGDGRLCWWRHTGQQNRTATWSGPVVLTTDAGRYTRLVGAGDGRLYGVLADGTLATLEHTSHLVGSPDLRPPATVDPGGSAARDWRTPAVLLARGQTLYALHDNGDLIWHRWGWLRLALRGTKASRVAWWRGPQLVATGLTGTQLLVPQLLTTEIPVVR